MKYHLIFIGFAFSIITYSCNSGGESRSDSKIESSKVAKINLDSFIDKRGIGNIIIPTFEAGRMTKQFENKFGMNETGLGIPVWIDASIVIEMSNYLNSKEEYDGLRFFFGVDKNVSAKNSIIMLVPTMILSGKGKQDFWPTDIPVDLTKTEFQYINKPQDQCDKMRIEFGKLYRKEQTEGNMTTAKIDSLSVKIWFDKESIDYLSQLLINNTQTIDGIRVYFGAYDKLDTKKHPGQKYVVQSTIIIVPTNRDKDHTDNWDIIKETISQASLIKRSALNHGQLCPNECN